MRRLLIAAVLLGHLLGVSLRPGIAADPVQEAIGRAVAWLHTQQLPDGSFGLRRPDGSSIPSASATADAIYALALVGEDPGGQKWTQGGHSAVDALATLAKSYVTNDAGRAGRVARAVARAGRNPHSFGGLDLIAAIQSKYDPVTGRYQSVTPLYGHTLAVEGLLRAGEPVPAVALDTLLAAQLPDGGWSWSFASTQSDVDSTGRVMQLLAGQAGLRCAGAYDRARAYLAAAQTSAGGWGVYPPPNTNPPNANSTALAVAGLRAIGVDPDGPLFQVSGRGALSTLLAFQEPSGEFVYIQQPGKEENRLMATLDALMALVQPLAAPVACQPLYLPLLLKP
jgi:hypothetical protein